MLYRLTDGNGLEPLGFQDFPREKDLENLLAENLFDKLFDQARLLPFHQERRLQPEADVYALNEVGDVVIFELKRAGAGAGALDQILRYLEDAAQWDFQVLNEKYNRYSKLPATDRNLRDEHKEAFGLKEPLPHEGFNRNQKLFIVGSAMDDALRTRVDFWQRMGLPIDFLPFRVYRIGEDYFFEFFAKPYDAHANRASRKGVLLDTNRTYDEEGMKWMMENDRVSAWGNRKDTIRSLSQNDLVFYYHRGVGIVGAARIVGNRVEQDADEEEFYWRVTFLTRKPIDFNNPPAMSIHQASQLTGKTFFLARTLKVPYLNSQEADALVEALQRLIGAADS